MKQPTDATPIYVVGDLQGCLEPLLRLLDRVQFDPARDRLWLTGDLVARGPDSLGCLRFVRELGSSCITVLGNHDLHLLALWRGQARKPAEADLAPILQASDADELLDWLRRQPLAHYDAARDTLMIHAGLAPQWTVAQARTLAADVETVLREDDALTAFCARMYGDQPERWSPSLAGVERLRFTVNVLTRARYCTADGRFEYRQKGTPGSQQPGWMPWFQAPERRSRDSRIVFGHWSALGKVNWPEHKVHGLDTGYVWGGALTALRLDDGTLYTQPAT